MSETGKVLGTIAVAAIVTGITRRHRIRHRRERRLDAARRRDLRTAVRSDDGLLGAYDLSAHTAFWRCSVI